MSLAQGNLGGTIGGEEVHRLADCSAVVVAIDCTDGESIRVDVLHDVLAPAPDKWATITWDPVMG